MLIFLSLLRRCNVAKFYIWIPKKSRNTSSFLKKHMFLAQTISNALRQNPRIFIVFVTGMSINYHVLSVKVVVRKQIWRQKSERREVQVQWKLGVTHSTRERQRERNTPKNSISNNALTQCTCVCVQCTLLYKSLQGLTEVLSYFNAL